MGYTALLVVALLWTVQLLDQPLWLDELHSSWGVAGDWPDVATRAEMGNQSPIYFWLLKLLTWTSGQHPWVLRVPSLISWLACVISMFAWLSRWQRKRIARQEQGWQLSCMALAFLFCSLCMDPMQMFFAVEARVYGVVQLVSLLSWMLVVEIVVASLSHPSELALNKSGERNNEFVPWHWIAWTACATSMIHLHITAGLSLIFQFPIIAYLAAKLVSWKQCTQRHVVLPICCLLWIIANGVYVLYVNQNVWERRKQWTAFAGDSSLESLIHLLPFLQVLLPIAACWAIDSLLPRKEQDVGDSKLIPLQFATNRIARLVWALAAICPCCLAWVLTRSQLAPLFHYRFLIVAALPLYMLAGTWLLTINRGALRALASAAIFLGLFISQGPWGNTLDSWRRARDEDWNSAAEFVSQNIHSESQSLWCYAGLIEGYQIDAPLTQTMDEYLSYPLRGIYRVEASTTTVQPHGLVGNRKQWLEQIRSTKHDAAWIIYRGPAERLRADLEAAGLSPLTLVHPIEQFGRVSVVCIK